MLAIVQMVKSDFCNTFRTNFILVIILDAILNWAPVKIVFNSRQHACLISCYTFSSNAVRFFLLELCVKLYKTNIYILEVIQKKCVDKLIH